MSFRRNCHAARGTHHDENRFGVEAGFFSEFKIAFLRKVSLLSSFVLGRMQSSSYDWSSVKPVQEFDAVGSEASTIVGP